MGYTAPGVCRESGSGQARLQEAALELSLPVARIGGLAVSRREAAGGGALSGVVYCLAAQDLQLDTHGSLASVLAKVPAALSTTSGGYRCHRASEKEHHTAPFAGFV